MSRLKCLSVAALALALVIPSTAQAQRPEKPWLLEASGAYVWTTGEYADLVKTGWAAGGLVGYAVNPAIYVMGSFNAQWWTAGGDCVLCVDWTNYSYFGMVGYNVGARSSKADVLLILGAGGATFGPDGADSQTYFALNSGIRSYFYATPTVAISVHVMASVAFAGDFVSSTIWSFPLGLGLAFRF